MKVILIQGEHTVPSRKRFLEIITSAKKKNWEIIRISTKDKFSLVEKLRLASLFQNQMLYVVEEANKLSSSDLSQLSNNDSYLPAHLLLWQKGRASQKLKKALPKDTKVENFDLPKIIFTFFASLYPGNSQKALILLHQLLEFEPIEFIFALSGRYFRDLYWTKIEPETLNYPAWRLQRLKKQASKFSRKHLKEIINQLSDIDIKAKTSKVSLAISLDLLISSKLE